MASRSHNYAWHVLVTPGDGYVGIMMLFFVNKLIDTQTLDLRIVIPGHR
jgi:hypothetical protein